MGRRLGLPRTDLGLPVKTFTAHGCIGMMRMKGWSIGPNAANETSFASAKTAKRQLKAVPETLEF
jgi:hypothetical protein